MAENYNSVKTIYGVALEASRRPGNSFEAIAYSTLNEYFGIESGTEVGEDDSPEIQYLVVGRGGHNTVVGSDNLVDNLQHRITNACLFEHLPFVMRTTDNDLSADERENYRMRKLLTVDGTSYFAYYMKVLDIPEGTPTVELLTVSSGETTREDYTPSADQLEPTAVSMTNGVVNTSTNEHLNVSTPFSFELTSDDITELLNCVDIIYGDSRYGVISEIGICSGVDSTVTSSDGGTDVTYTEAIAAQVFNFIGTSYTLSSQSTGQEFNFRLGSTLPYYK